MNPVAPLIQISDHAVVRYMERVLGVDIAGLRERIAAECPAGLAVGTVVSIRDGHEYHIEDGVLVTVIPKRGKHR